MFLGDNTRNLKQNFVKSEINFSHLILSSKAMKFPFKVSSCNSEDVLPEPDIGVKQRKDEEKKIENYHEDEVQESYWEEIHRPKGATHQ